MSGGLLCVAVTQPMIKVRVLGLSLNAEIPSNAALFATGNNLTIGTDMARRMLLCGLDPQLERPELREFAGDPHEIARCDRGRYVAAALTCLRAFHVAGRPEIRPPVGSFADWSLLIRNALLWLGEADPCETMERARKADLKLKALETVMNLWEANAVLADRRKTASELIAVALEEEPSADRSIRYRYSDFRDALLAIAGEGGGGLSARRVGKWLHANEGRVCAGRRIVQDGGRRGVVLWKLELVEAP